MKIHRRIIFIIIFPLLLSSRFVSADEEKPTYKAVTVTKTSAFIIPAEYEGFREAVKTEIEKREALEFLNTEIKNITYGKDGKISSVEYLTGETVEYSYKYDEHNKLVSVALTASNGVKIVISEEPPDSMGSMDSGEMTEHQDDEIYISIEYPEESGIQDESGTTHEPTQTVIVIRAEDEFDLEEIAATPIEFNLFREVKEALDKAIAEREVAYKEYMKKTKTYYVDTHQELKTRFSLLESEGIDLTENFKNLSEEDITSAAGREAIDAAVGYIRSEVGEDVSGKEASNEFLTLEGEYREKILALNNEVYEGKVEKALEYIYGVIDELLNSRLALYLNNKNEKIEVIVNLPTIKEKE